MSVRLNGRESKRLSEKPQCRALPPVGPSAHKGLSYFSDSLQGIG